MKLISPFLLQLIVFLSPMLASSILLGQSAIWALNDLGTTASTEQTAAQTVDVSPALLMPFYTGNWEEAKQQARQSGKNIVVEVYSNVNSSASHRMETDVYTNPSVQSVYNQNFMVVRINVDAELDAANQAFLTQHPVAFVPSYFYFTPQGDYKGVANGFQNSDKFLQLANKFIANQRP